MSSYNSKIYHSQGGDLLGVKSGGEIKIEAGGKITNNGTQASAITDVTGGSTVDTEARAALNNVLAALRGVGIISSS